MSGEEFYTLGKGELLFAPFVANTKIPGGFVSFGNCPAFTLSGSSEEITHFSSMGGVKEEDANAQVSNTLGATLQFDSLSPRNLAKWFLGTSEVVTQASASGLTENFSAVEQGAMYVLGVSETTPTGHRNVTVSSVTDDAGTPTVFTVNDDYVVDDASGEIVVVEGGAISDGTNLVVTYDVAAATYDRVISGNSEIAGALLFKSNNPTGPDRLYRMPYVKLRPNGDLPLISDTWISAEFNIKCLKLPNYGKLYSDGALLA
jgi:hypothetical protein